MSKKNLIILILIEILSILLFKTIEYSGVSIPTYDISKLNILLGIVIVILGLFLLLYAFKLREDYYIDHLSQADKDFYNILITELDAQELSIDLNGHISDDMLFFLYKSGQKNMESEHQSPKKFKNVAYDTYESPCYQALFNQLISKYRKKTKLLSVLNTTIIVLVVLIAFNFAMNGFNFNANYFRISLPSSLLLFGLINVFLSVLIKHYSHVKHWKIIHFGIAFALNISAAVLLNQLTYIESSNHAILNFIARGKIEFIPHLYVLLGAVTLIIALYVTQKSIRNRILNSVI